MRLTRGKFMKKIGIIRCQQTEDYCPGTKCLLTSKEGKDSLTEAGLGACEVVGLISCGGCPGKRSVLRALELVKRGAEVIMMSSCISLGTPIGFPCPHKGQMFRAIKAKLPENFPLVEYSHIIEVKK